VINHWASSFYLNDRADVYLAGVKLGFLDRPSSSDNLLLEAKVELDHEHDHRTGDNHTHTHDDGNYSASVGLHEHPLDGAGTEIVVPTSTTVPFQISNPGVDRFTNHLAGHLQAAG
jgi:hypothetical protein